MGMLPPPCSQVGRQTPSQHRDAPIPHRAAGFGFGDRGKALQGLGVPERMQGPHGFSKRLLDGRPTGDLEVNFTRRIRCRWTLSGRLILKR